MKSIRFKSVLGLALGVLALTAVSCNPDEPSNEKKHPLHEEPVKAVCILQEGTLKPGKLFENNPRIADFTTASGLEQRIEWQSVEKEGWKITSETKAFKVKNTQAANSVVYRLQMKYYDEHGKLMNEQFYTQGQNNIHQHFFVTYKDNKLVTDKQALPYDYRYADELNGNYVADKDPLGFDGFIRFTKPATSFDLSIEMLHAAGSKYDGQGKPSPFYHPSDQLRKNGDWDVSVKVPVTIE